MGEPGAGGRAAEAPRLRWPEAEETLVRSSRNRNACCALALTVALVLPAAAQQAPPEEVEVDRDAGLLLDDIHAAPDRDGLDTALVFSNQLEREVRVGCRAFGRDGQLVGRAGTGLPARALRYLRASDFAPGGDFVGSVECLAGGRVLAEALLLAPGGITNLEVLQRPRGRSTRLEFPLVANR